VAAVVTQLFLPLIPLLLEILIAGKLSEQTLCLTAAMYVTAVGVSSRSVAILALAIMVAVLLSGLFGYLAAGKPSLALPIRPLAMVPIFAFMFIHGVERYNKHIVEGSPFFERPRE
jgi:hypothetical protein